MKKIYSSILLLLLAVSFFQCRKEPAFVGEPDPVPVVITPDPITASLQGNILDENDQPAAGVTIKAGNQTTVTNDKGYFRINNAALDKKGSLVIAEKSGYFKGIRLFSATSGTNYISVKLIKKVLAGTINSGSGGAVSLPNGSQVSLPANGIVMASSGNNYSGTVNVYAQYIDPSAADIAKIVPGSFAAYDKDGQNVILTSYGMMAVELESATGEKLQIKDGSAAILTSPIPAAVQASAPATIALWYVDEQTGFWREEGTATKQGNSYVGTVKHFTFWNCDFENNAVILSMTILNAGNLPLVNSPVRITRPGASWLTAATGYTDSLGQVSGIVPSNENLVVEVLDPCGNPAYSQNISPLSQNTDLGNITVAASSAGVVTIRGKLVTCDNLPVSDGYVLITFENSERFVPVNSSGGYEASFVICPNSPAVATIVAVDNGSGAQQSSTVVVNLTTPVSNVADIVTCGASPFGYVNYNIDGVNYYWTQNSSFNFFGIYYPAMAGPGTDAVLFQTDNLPDSRQFTLNIAAARTTGTFPATFTSTDAFTGGQLEFIPGFTATLTSYASGWPDWFEGSFSGQYKHSSTGSTIHTINGTFRIPYRF